MRRASQNKAARRRNVAKTLFLKDESLTRNISLTSKTDGVKMQWLKWPFRPK
jgi:hypothetical protein